MTAPTMRTNRNVPADPVEDADRADRLHGSAARCSRGCAGDLGGGGEQPGRLGPRAGLSAHGLVVVGPGRMARPGLRPRADGADGGGRADPAASRRPGEYPRGGRIHLRLWLAERLADELGAANLAGAAWMPTYARALGAKIGKQVDLHSIPPVTGMLTLGDGCSVEPEVDLSRPLAGRRRAAHRRDQGRRRCARGHPQHALPGGRRGARRRGRSRVGGRRHGHEGRVLDRVARRARGPDSGPVVGESPRPQPGWVLAYAAIASVISLLPIVAVRGRDWRSPCRGCETRTRSARRRWCCWRSLPLRRGGRAASSWRCLSRAGTTPRDRVVDRAPTRSTAVRAWQAWATMKVLDEARTGCSLSTRAR